MISEMDQVQQSNIFKIYWGQVVQSAWQCRESNISKEAALADTETLESAEAMYDAIAYAS